MVKDALGAVGSVATLVKKVLDRLWGNQTSAQAHIDQETKQAKAEFEMALRRGDLAACNAAIERLRELRDQAAARLSGQ